MRFVDVFFVASTVCMLFGTHESYGMYFQIIAVLLILAMWGGLLLAGAGSDFIKSGWLFWFLAVPVSIQSCLVSLVYENYALAGYSLFFTISLFSVQGILGVYGLNRLIDLYVYSSGIMVVIIVAAEWQSLYTALSITQQETGLFRFTPFDNHPNLIAHVFGFSAVLSFYRARLVFGKWKKIAFLFVFFAALVIIVAASSRGALLAVFVSIVTASLLSVFNDGVKLSKSLVLKLIFACGAVGFFIGYLDYFFQMLDMGSEYRGVGSGGSGRANNWNGFLDYFFSDYCLVIFGHGFRSWVIAELGYDSDNSYITLLYEVGLFSTLIILAGLFQQYGRSLVLAVNDKRYVIYFAALGYVLFESIVARYMIAIGNPAAFVGLAIFLAGLKGAVDDRQA